MTSKELLDKAIEYADSPLVSDHAKADRYAKLAEIALTIESEEKYQKLQEESKRKVLTNAERVPLTNGQDIPPLTEANVKTDFKAKAEAELPDERIFSLDIGFRNDIDEKLCDRAGKAAMIALRDVLKEGGY